MTNEEFQDRVRILRTTIVEAAKQPKFDNEVFFASLVNCTAALIYDISDGDRTHCTNGIHLFVSDVLECFDQLDASAPGRLH
jgi:hypothetical protein